MGGYITDFAVDCTKSYSVTKRDLFKGPCGRYLSTLSIWINRLQFDKNFMKMEFDS
jgi:hypothetical protein